MQNCVQACLHAACSKLRAPAPHPPKLGSCKHKHMQAQCALCRPRRDLQMGEEKLPKPMKLGDAVAKVCVCV